MSIARARLEIIKDDKFLKEFILDQDIVGMGRAEENAVVLNESNVSRYHAELNLNGDRYFITDLSSYCGTWVNQDRVNPQVPIPLVHGDTVRIGSFDVHFLTDVNVLPPQMSVNRLEATVFGPPANSTAVALPTTVLDLRGRSSFSIGRDRQNDIAIEHPTVSRFHAHIERKDGSVYITDLSSTNGTFINGKPIHGTRLLRAGDTIRIGASRMVLHTDEKIIREDEQGNLRLDAINLRKVVGKGTTILNDISLSIMPREFVVIAGVSGGGKSTLLDALNGFRPATSGSVLVNNTDLYKNFNAYRTQLGYVPQDDIIHKELTVRQALNFAARLRMPADTTDAERQQRLNEVLDDLELTHRQNVPVKNLSGGQRKRVSIGVELLTKPSLFFLDEATSGLDPGTEAQIMRLLRKLADQGRTVLLITHATKNVTMCDLVVFLAKGGRVAYLGPPQEAIQYFGVQEFDEIYDKVEDELSPEEWQKRYKESPQYQKYVVERQSILPQPQSDPQQVRRPKQQQSASQTKNISGWQQFVILSQRNITILMRDRASLILMLAIAPILGILDFITWQKTLFDPYNGDAGQAITMLFVAVLIAFLVGNLTTMREIVKEVEIYRRERTIGLHILPYILSKVWIGVLLALYQAAIFLLAKKLAVEIPGGAETLVSMYVTLVLATIAGMVMGLLISALSPNQNIAPLLTIIFLVPQITFGGGMLPIKSFGLPGQLINHITLTKWSFEALVTITELGRDVAEDHCWQLSEAQRKQLTDQEKNQRCQCLGTKVFQSCKFPGLKAKYDSAVDEPEPQKPTFPGDPPSDPQKLSQYKEKVNEYNREIESWQNQYSDWKQKYQTAIGAAEAVIDRFYQDYGAMFKVNIIKHWTALGLIVLAMFGILLGVQQHKDII